MQKVKYFAIKLLILPQQSDKEDHGHGQRIPQVGKTGWSSSHMTCTLCPVHQRQLHGQSPQICKIRFDTKLNYSTCCTQHNSIVKAYLDPRYTYWLWPVGSTVPCRESCQPRRSTVSRASLWVECCWRRLGLTELCDCFPLSPIINSNI